MKTKGLQFKSITAFSTTALEMQVTLFLKEFPNVVIEKTHLTSTFVKEIVEDDNNRVILQHILAIFYRVKP